ncbi:MAG: HypC/HybG/HupF family hydrogenase formation chaperone [Candidatus Thermoplasmatota archaeon]|nr:HypC/HybG/HupF family hydrogenase formation chaperone [Candidatus Thermoplasmatota archaeon]MBS3789587.1 HypC/HybG/HupF family hydrogenase formation chaperone [Candidatus Thermoplasmatota archaeon]
MCLAVPGLIENIEGDTAEIDFGGVTREANISLVEADIGDYVIVHAGYAIEKLEEEEAQKSLDAWDEVLEAAKRAEQR